MHYESQLARFEQAILPHLDAAYNLARWLTRRDQDAEDVAQEAFLRAFKFFGSFHGSDGRTWLLTIVRNTCYTWMQKNLASQATTTFDEEMPGVAVAAHNPEVVLLRTEDVQLIRDAIDELPAEFREMIVLRELEGLSYREIADIAGIPWGTVMSRLARGRERLQHILAKRVPKEP